MRYSIPAGLKAAPDHVEADRTVMCHTLEVLWLHYYNSLGLNQLKNNNTWWCQVTKCLLHDCALLCIVSPPSKVPGSRTTSPQSPWWPWHELPAPLLLLGWWAMEDVLSWRTFWTHAIARHSQLPQGQRQYHGLRGIFKALNVLELI